MIYSLHLLYLLLYFYIQVKVEDIQGRMNEINRPFSLDNSKPTLKFFSQWPLNIYFPNLVSIHLFGFKVTIL